jgi:predicted site-specific integrase-resolvase
LARSPAIPETGHFEELDLDRKAQRPGLHNQRRIVEDFCLAKAIANVEFIEEIERLAGFGFDLLKHVFQSELLVLNTEQVSPEQELVQDFMAITHRTACCAAAVSPARSPSGQRVVATLE